MQEIMPCSGDAPQKKAKENAIGNSNKKIFIPHNISFKKNENEYLSTSKFRIEGHNSNFLMASS